MKDTDLIVPGLWQGAKPKPGGFVALNKFTLLILCAEEFQPPASAYPGVQVIHAPNYDDRSIEFSREHLRVALQAAKQAAQAITEGGRVLCTCWAGVNRSGLVSALTIHHLYGHSGEECIKLVRRKRRPQQYDLVPLSNEQFVEALRRLPARAPTATVPEYVGDLFAR